MGGSYAESFTYGIMSYCIDHLHSFLFSNKQLMMTKSIKAHKTGEEESCEWLTIGKTSWGCTHDGRDAYIVKWKKSEYKSSRESERIDIADGIDGNFRFTVQHWFSRNENDPYYDKDHRLRDEMTLWINSEKRGVFSKPENRHTDTHLPDGSVNPAYKDRTYVDVTCDHLCNCDVVENSPF